MLKLYSKCEIYQRNETQNQFWSVYEQSVFHLHARPDIKICVWAANWYFMIMKLATN